MATAAAAAAEEAAAVVVAIDIAANLGGTEMRYFLP